jgi:predicted acylesterase/phospholipase RssA
MEMVSAYTTIGFGGGGIKGILHIGALLEIMKHQPLVFPNGVYGCSVGSIVATAVAFGCDITKAPTLIKKYFTVDKFIPVDKIGISQINNIILKNGVFTMDAFIEMIIELFNEFGIDIKTKTLGDANMPLYIVSSNIGKGIPTVFSDKVPVIDALRCSCAIPFVFEPQTLYGQVYVDGSLFPSTITRLVAAAPAAASAKSIIFSLSVKTTIDVPNDNIFEYLYKIYSIAAGEEILQPNSISLSYPCLTSHSDLSKFNIDDIIAKTRKRIKMELYS